MSPGVTLEFSSPTCCLALTDFFSSVNAIDEHSRGLITDKLSLRLNEEKDKE